MTTLENILHLIWLVDQNTIVCRGLALRLLAGYQSKECKETYKNYEKFRRRDFEELIKYPQHWIDAAYLIRDLRQQS